MPKIYDEQVDFTTTSVASNQNDAASIQPIVGGENLWENVLNRTPENLRGRTEALRTAVEDLKYYADYDRAFVLRAEATTFSCVSDIDGYRLVMTGGPLWIYPALTPGQKSGGRLRGARMFIQNGSWVPYAGTLGTNDLSFVATGEFTGMRGYAESDDMAAGSFTVGGNRLRISLVANPAAVGGPSSISATVTGAPATLITITYGTLTTATTINQIIAWIAADLNSQGAYGLAHMLRGVTTSAGTSAPPAITNGVFQGGYDAEAHQITDFVTFFAVFTGGVYVNRLNEGESLALAFVPGPVEAGTGATGGRRQALIDLPIDRIGGNTNNTRSDTILFNTGREPEKIPGAIPIGKLVNGKFVFIDGTIIGTAPISLGESGTTLGRLAAPTGGMMVGYDGSGNWNPDATTNPALVSTTVGAALDEIVTRLGGYAAGDSGARRIGMEPVSGVASDGNAALNLTTGITSLRNALTQILNAVGSATVPGGVNARVSEYGHRMQGFNPIEKVFSATAPVNTVGGGAQMIRAVLNKPETNLLDGAQVEEQAFVSLLPAYFDTGSSETLLEKEPIGPGPTASTVQLTGLSSAGALRAKEMFALTSEAPELHCIVEITASSSDDGFYFADVLDANASPPTLSLRYLNGSAWDNSGNLSGAEKLTFFVTTIEGNSLKGIRSRRMVPESLPEAHEHIYGSGVIRRGYDREGLQRFEEGVNGAVWELNATPIVVQSDTGTLTFTSAGPNLITVTGLTGMAVGDLGSTGRYLRIVGATGGLAPINGTWRIVGVGSTASATIFSDAGVTSDSASLSWSELYDLARRTENILRLEDARLLKGIELGSPADASPNHHHASLYAPLDTPYTKTVLYDSPQSINVAGWSTTLDTVAVGTTLTTDTYGGAIPSGFTKKAGIFRVEISGSVATAVDVGYLLGLNLQFQGAPPVGVSTCAHQLKISHTVSPYWTPAYGQIDVLPSNSILDGETFTLDDGLNSPVTFEYRKSGPATGSNVLVRLYTGDDGEAVARDTAYAINAVARGNTVLLNVEANSFAQHVLLTNPGRRTQLLTPNTAISHTVTDPGFSTTPFSGARAVALSPFTKTDQIIVPVHLEVLTGVYQMSIKLAARTVGFAAGLGLTIYEIGAVLEYSP